MATNRLCGLTEFGQSVWLDNISRPLLQSGELRRLIEEDGLQGMTSNPTIWEKAISGGDSYDADIAALAGQGKSVNEIYEALAFTDIRAAADALRPVYDRTQGADGFVSLEVAPGLAHDTAGTLAEVKRLFAALDRPNVMIKIPATPEGVLAVKAGIAAGVNVNSTLMFALSAYEAIANAYIEGLEERVRAGLPINGIASVASFFVSRVDSSVDKLLAGKPGGEALAGKAAIANARLAYERFSQIFSGPRWLALAERGARVQRPLWASTSTKNPAYPDTLYVDALIGPDTVDTMPPQTIDAFRDHGHLAQTVTHDLAAAQVLMGQLAEMGIDMEAVTQALLVEGVDAFAASFNQMMQELAAKMERVTN